MSDSQSNPTETSKANDAEPADVISETSQRRRRRRVETTSELDSDRAFTNEDVLAEAKSELETNTTNESAESAPKRRRRTATITSVPKQGADDTQKGENPDIQQSNDTNPRKRTRRKQTKTVQEEPKLPENPSIGATISADVANQLTNFTNAKKTKQKSKNRRSKSKSKDDKISHVSADLGVDDNFELDKKILKKRMKNLGSGKATGRYCMYVHVDTRGNTQLAITEGRILTEHYVSRADLDDTVSIDGNIYLGKVQNVLPGMEAAFVDIATPKNAVLYRADVMYEKEKYSKPPKIEESLQNGQMVLVQVTKNPIAHKGARLTQEVSLAGRFVVLIPKQPETYGISKRLPDEERRRLRRILDEIRPNDAGLIVRTAAEGATDDELRRDMERLSEQWNQIKSVANKADKSKTATLLYKEPPLVMRMIREEFNKEFRSIVIDNENLYNKIKAYVDSITPELSDRVEFYSPNDELDIYERYHVTEQLTKALDKKVWLPSGGSLIIERTEALTVIDVNTGKNVGSSNLEETVFMNNLEAADEIARQLRLRDIGGIIVIDFIDMEIEKNRFVLTERLRDALSRDKTRTQVFEVTELGLVQMTRKRLSEGMVESFADVCPTCEGRGFVIDQGMVGGFSPVELSSGRDNQAQPPLEISQAAENEVESVSAH